MEFELSIEKSKAILLNELCFFERRTILQHYFKNGLKINEKEKTILNSCPAQEQESISIIGVLLNDETPLNTFRLRIGSVFLSDTSLSNSCKKKLNETIIKNAEDALFHWEYDYNNDVERPIVELYVNLFES